MCFNQRCENVEKISEKYSKCEKNCNGNGFCNSNGNCHCNDGFDPPLCKDPGPGGSIDSGPANRTGRSF